MIRAAIVPKRVGPLVRGLASPMVLALLLAAPGVISSAAAKGPAAAAPAPAAAGDTPPVPADTLVSVGTHRLHVMSAGTGSPAIVIDVGFGDSLDGWTPLVQKLAATTRVVTYERAGYGSSEAGPYPRTAEREVEELARALGGARVPPPYVFVGHSLGGINALVMGARHPELTAGLVLVDPAPIDFLLGKHYPELRADADNLTADLARQAAEAEASADPEARAAAARLRTLASEHEMLFSQSAEQAAAVDSLGSTRLTVIAAGNANPAFGAVAFKFQDFWLEANERLTTLSTRGKFVLAHSGHYVHREKPDLVVAEIAAMVDSVRAEAKGRKE